MSKRKVVVLFGCVGSSCEGVDSNEWLPLHCKLCSNINDVYFGKYDFFLRCSCENGLCAHTNRSILIIWHSLIFREFFAYVWLEIWDVLHTPKYKAAYLSWFAAWACEFVEVLNHWVIPIKWITQAFLSFSRWIWLVRCLFEGYKNMAFFLCIPSFNYYNLKIQRVVHTHFSFQNSSSPIFQDLAYKFILNSKLVHEYPQPTLSEVH